MIVETRRGSIVVRIEEDDSMRAVWLDCRTAMASIIRAPMGACWPARELIS
jgi:hypothetical protein